MRLEAKPISADRGVVSSRCVSRCPGRADAPPFYLALPATIPPHRSRGRLPERKTAGEGGEPERIGGVRARALPLSNGKLLGRPPANGVNYLLAGMLICGTCGSSLEARTRAHARRGVWGRVLRVRWLRSKGPHICSNRLTIPMATADEGILSSVERLIVNPEVAEEATRQALAVDATKARHAALAADPR